MRRTTIGRLLVDQALPEDLRGKYGSLDKKGLEDLLTELAQKHPEKYRETVKKLSDVGREAAFTTGGHSFGLRHLRQTLAGRQARQELSAELAQIYANPRLSDEAREAEVVAATQRHQAKLPDAVLQEAWDTDNPLARQLKGAGRGNKASLSSLLGADLLYTDHAGETVPVPVLRSYSMGLRPHEYFAGAAGTRKGVVDLKQATADSGFFAKQLGVAAHRLVVTADDDEQPYDISQPRGLPADTDDPDNVGALLAQDLAGYPRNTELTPRILADLKAKGHSRLLLRSPLVGGPEDGGVYARDVGRREKGRLAPLGDWVGLAGSQAIAEPVTQGMINSKHAGGVAGQGPQRSGFAYLNALIQNPQVFPGGAAHAQLDGKVRHVEPAPQGGYYVQVENERHYVPANLPLKVKQGDTVEAGDVLSEGAPHPGEIVRHKGLGEGRRYFVQAFGDALRNSGQPGHRRNVELLARGLLNHVRLTEELGDYVPDDLVPYHALERAWQPRPGHYAASPQQALGTYLERPILHYTVGTKVRPSMLKDLSQFGVGSLTVHREPPPFEPEQIRGMELASKDPEWLPRFLGGYQEKSLLDATHRGLASDERSTSYVPALVRGEAFGRTGPTQGWKPEPPTQADPKIKL